VEAPDLTEREREFRAMLYDDSEEGRERRRKWFRTSLARWNASPAGILAKRQWEQKAKRTRVSGEE